MGHKTNTSSNTTAPPDDIMAAYQALIKRAQGDANRPYTPTIAPFNAQQRSAFQAFNRIPGQYLPQARQYAEQGAAPITEAGISRYYNPFQQSVIDATMGNINETNAQQQNQVVGNAISQGALGGNRVKVAQSELARQQDLSNNQTLAGLNAANYQQALAAAQGDRSAAAQGANQFMGLQSSALQGAGAQLASGQVQQDRATGILQQKAAFPYQQTNWLAQLLGGIGPLEGGTSTSETPGPSGLSQLVGLGTSALGAFGGKGMKGVSPPAGLFARGGGVSSAHDMASSVINLARVLRGGIGGYAGGGTPSVIDEYKDLYSEPYGGIFFPPSVKQLAPKNLGPVGGISVPPYTPPVDLIAGPALPSDTPPAPEPVPSAPDSEMAYDAPPPLTAGIDAAANVDAGEPQQGGLSPAALAAISPKATPASSGQWRIPIIAAGLGMMASQSPWIGTAIGEGGLQGLGVYAAQKKSAAEQELAKSELGLRGRSIDMEAERLQQQAAQYRQNIALETERLSEPQSAAGKLSWDLSHGNLTQEAYDKATAANGALLSPDAVDLITDQVLAGDMTAMSGYARNPVTKAQIVNALAVKANEQGLNGAQIAANVAAYGGDKAAQRSAGTRAAQVGMAASEANQMADIALDASKAVPRGDIVPWTKAVQAVQTGTSSPEMAAFVTATTSLVNAYARAVSPLGAPTDAMRQHAEAMLNVAQGPDAYAAVIKQMKKEMQAALNAPVEIRQRLIDRGIGKPENAESEVPGADAPPMEGAKKAPDGNWYVPNPDKPGGYLMVQP